MLMQSTLARGRTNRNRMAALLVYYRKNRSICQAKIMFQPDIAAKRCAQRCRLHPDNRKAQQKWLPCHPPDRSNESQMCRLRCCGMCQTAYWLSYNYTADGFLLYPARPVPNRGTCRVPIRFSFQLSSNAAPSFWHSLYPARKALAYCLFF